MRLLASYIVSHIYDIYSIVAATMVVAAMMYIKVPVKRKIRGIVNNRIKKNPDLEDKRSLLIRRGNMSLIIMVFPLAIVAFAVLILLSPYMHFSWQSSFMAGVFALCIYAFLEQVSKPSENKD